MMDLEAIFAVIAVATTVIAAYGQGKIDGLRYGLGEVRTALAEATRERLRLEAYIAVHLNTPPASCDASERPAAAGNSAPPPAGGGDAGEGAL